MYKIIKLIIKNVLQIAQHMESGLISVKKVTSFKNS